MARTNKTLWMAAATALVVLATARNADACAMCAGAKTDGLLAQGMNWGIFSLLFVVTCVLGGVATFAFMLVRRAAAYESSLETPVDPETAPASAKV